MKRSIFIAFLILASVVGWIGSGQFSNNVVAQDENIEALSESDTSYSQNNDNKESEEFTFSVETKIFKSSLIDQSIELQGQTIHNKKIDPNIRELENSLSNKVGLNVVIKNDKKNKGTITFTYKEMNQLNKIIEILKSYY